MKTPIHLCTWGEQCDALRAWHETMRRKVRVYDNGGSTADRYTVFVLRQEKGKQVADVYTMSENALAPDGINQFSHTMGHDIRYFPWVGKVSDGFKRSKVQDLPKDVISAIENRIK